MMDKNKALYKLKGLPHIYYINLDEQPSRREYMENMFEYWEVKNYTRISAYDGREDDLGDILKGRYPDNMSSGEVGCSTSHLKAIKHFLENSDAPCALIMEDDCDINTVSHWSFSWKDFFCKIPYDYDTACYLIHRRYGQKLMDLHVRGDKYKLDNGVKPRAVADDLVYNSGNTFAIPLFLYTMELGSSIHDDHLDVFHKSSYEGLWNFWKTDSTNVEDWNSVFEYDPYFGTLPPGFEGK